MQRLRMLLLTHAVLFILVGSAVPLDAGVATLDVCNRGHIAVDVFDGGNETFPRSYWEVESFRIDPGACRQVYHSNAGTNNEKGDGRAAYIGFAFTDARGRWGGVRNDRPPDLGFVTYSAVEAMLNKARGHDVLTSAQQAFCVPPGGTHYKTYDQPGAGCATLSVNGKGAGQFLALPASFYFVPEGSWCSSFGSSVSCAGGDYYLNIATDPSTRQISVMRGSKEHVDSPLQDREEAARLLAEIRARQEKQEQNAKARQFELDQKKTDSLKRSVAQFSPQWIGQFLIVKGTISSVQKLRSTWVQLSFEESPSRAFTACFVGSLFDGFHDSGPNFQGLVGKTVEMRGRIRQPNSCGGTVGGLEMTVPSQIWVF